MESGSATSPIGDASPDIIERLDLARRFVEVLLPGAVPASAEPQPVFLLPTTQGIRERFLELQRRLAPLGLLPLLRSRGGQPMLILVPKPPPGRWNWQVNALLLLATIASTFYAGYAQSLSLVQAGYLTDAVTGGIAFSASVLFILGAHEMGHKIVALRRGIDASLPYFLPMVPPVGTMGAVIVTRTPAPNRDSLMDLGASGPIAGFLAAIPVLFYGIARSFIVGPERLEGLISIPDPLLIRWLIQVILNPAPDAVVLGHPVLFAGWIGLIVTSINLLPAGMLDGGHAVRAAFGSRMHLWLSYAGAALAAAMGFIPMALLILLLMRRGHAGPLDDLSPLSPARRLVGLALVAIFVLSAVFIPLPSL
ncbi:MAG: site-2 protease family protein [Armatimonadetes bacterium]|nr:site-2 protease family protein [Armatimonadota bacterium]